MILRRVIAHFQRQEWTAIAIDFVIVVVGVFIGIQVSNLNAARADQARGRAYLDRIRADLTEDVAQYDNRIRFWTEVSEYGLAGLHFSERGDAGGRTPWQLTLAYFQASQVAEYFSARSTYDEIQSAGELGLIGDPNLRVSLGRYYSNTTNAGLSERPAYREHVRGAIPIDIQLHIWKNCYRSSTNNWQEMFDCPSPVDEAVAAGIARRIAGDAVLMAELRYWMSAMTATILIAQNQRAYAVEILNDADKALGAGASG